MATTHYLYEVQDRRRNEYSDPGNWGILSTLKDAMLFTINKFAGASGFNETTPLEEMFSLGRDNCWWWEGSFPRDLRIQRVKMDSLTADTYYVMFKEWPDHFPKKLFKEVQE